MDTHTHTQTHTCFCPVSISWQMLGATKVIVLNIALLFLHLALPPLTCTARSEPGIQSLSQPLECFFPGRILQFAWISNMTLVTGNNTQEALLSHSRRESDQDVWDDGVDLGFRSKYLYPVVTGCEEMDWSHVSYILTPLTPLLLPLFLHHHHLNLWKFFM